VERSAFASSSVRSFDRTGQGREGGREVNLLGSDTRPKIGSLLSDGSGDGRSLHLSLGVDLCETRTRKKGEG